MPIRVALVNDDELVARGLDAMLRSEGDRFRVTPLPPAGIPDGEVDIALYDTLGREDPDGSEVAGLLADPRISRVAVYTWNFQPWLAEAALALGISGYLAKSLPARHLVDALAAIHDGEVVVSPGPGRNGKAPGDWPGREQGLTARQAEVLALITAGLGNSEIAEHTGLSGNSIKSYIRSAYRKIEVTSRSRAVLRGVSHGLRPDPALAEGAADDAAMESRPRLPFSP